MHTTPPVGSGDDGGVRELPDGFIQSDCTSGADCDDADPCTVDTCGLDRRCMHAPKTCELEPGFDPACNEGVCEPSTGECKSGPAHESGPCMLNSNTPGQCLLGVCSTTPQCALQTSILGCKGTKSISSFLSGTSLLDNYACANGLTGPEKAWRFRSLRDRQVTVRLTSTEDVDLIVLEGSSCVGNVACIGSSITAGAGEESVSFLAKADTIYVAVIESRGASTANFQLALDCADCEPVSTLACNQTVAGDTTKGEAHVGSWTCYAQAAGPEQTYRLAPTAATDYRITLTGLKEDLDLVVLQETSAACDPEGLCRGSSSQSGTADEKVEFSASANVTYTVAVESKMAGGPYQLKVECPPSCVGRGYTLSCGSTEAYRNDDSARSTNVVDAWSCAPDTTGPEVVYRFRPPNPGSYTFEISGLSADLDLIVIEGSSISACDATAACVASSTKTGTANESVTFQGDPAKYYFIAIDGKNGAVSPFQLKLRSSACPAPSCYNGLNSLSCGSPTDMRSNDDPSRSRNLVDAWACAPDTTGPEVVYRFTPPNDGTYTVELTDLTDDLDLIVVEGTSGTCSSQAACLASSVKTGVAAESVTFQGMQGKYYYIAVDGKDGAVSPYTIKLKSDNCPAASCYNGANTLSCAWREDRRRSDDAARSKNQVDKWACATGTTGPEVVYRFTPSFSGTYTVDLDGMTADLDLIVVSNTSSATCDSGAQCVASSVHASGNESVTFDAMTGRTYYIAVDGKDKAAGDYRVRLSSPVCPAPACRNINKTLSCLSPTVSGRNDATNGTNNVDAWGGVAACATGTTGPEVAHYFSPTVSGTYRVQLVGQKADLDLLVMRTSPSGTCDPAATCLAASQNGSTADESVTFQATANQGYWIVVDGKDGAVSPYALVIVDGCP